jgi:DNA-binding winged helix-turn-helix (wHTH) protein
MTLHSIESAYPLSFREEDAKALGEHLHHRHSVDLIGMKRVGISNFLRYFLYHDAVKETFISKEEDHLFIPVDLNDLVERELYAFWMLTFKRVIDVVEDSDLPKDLKQKISLAFLSAIQTQDLFLLLDGLRRSMGLLVHAGILPTIFFLRFDRIKDAVTPEFVDNLQGLRDATHEKLCYVFTSFRSLDALCPQAFTKASLNAFSQVMYIRPSLPTDMQTIIEQYNKRYSLLITQPLEQELLHLVGGNVQYMQTILVILSEHKELTQLSLENLREAIQQDERINLLGEELWESLSSSEKEILAKIDVGGEISEEEKKTASYIFETGMVTEKKDTVSIFNPFFAEYVKSVQQNVSKERELVFSKKEHLLFTLLQSHVGEICERDLIIEAVWPEYREFGVSDWSIDRLVARVRSKLKKQASPFEIRTIRTRGYMLTERS